MNAFVLSGGGNLGAVQAGMLEALLEAGIRPDLLVGASIGAANAAFLAGDPSLDGARALSALWRRTRPADIFPLSPIRALRAILRGESLFPRGAFRHLLEREIPYRRVEEAPVPVRMVATPFEDGEEVVFDSGPVADAVLASTALPGVFGPHRVYGHRYLDGGLSDQVPLGPAIEAGADTIYVLSVGYPCPPPDGAGSARAELIHSLALLLSQRLRLEETHLAEENPALRIVRLRTVCAEAGLLDLSRTPELIRRGRAETRRFLAREPSVAGSDVAGFHDRPSPRPERGAPAQIDRLKGGGAHVHGVRV